MLRVRKNGQYRTSFGAMYVGDSLRLLQSPTFSETHGKVRLVLTSPPFPLLKKKSYGNKRGDDYIAWLCEYALVLKRILYPRGSIAIEIGNAWEPGTPTMSTVPIEALLAFKKAGGFHLCQEFIYYNPARLPSPVEWVNRRRCRVKDAFTRIWWLSPSPQPVASNRPVLVAYSESMKRLLARGTYNGGNRPSQHKIGADSFLRQHTGAIPPNVLIDRLTDHFPDLMASMPDLHGVIPIANTASGDPYNNYCRRSGILPHPARMPVALASFFIRMTTKSGELVLDPFAGSNTTGFAAEELGRRWASVELDSGFARASAERFR